MNNKVYEVMEKYSDCRFLVCTRDYYVYMGYKAVCKSYVQNLWVEEIEILSNNTVLIIVY